MQVRLSSLALAGELLEVRLDLLRLRRDLPRQQHVAVFGAERDRDLACVLIDSEVQHGCGSPVG
jgi:hypothetical protein